MAKDWAVGDRFRCNEDQGCYDGARAHALTRIEPTDIGRKLFFETGDNLTPESYMFEQHVHHVNG